jgi:hypothetical protein
MKRVYEYIGDRTTAFARQALFSFLRDESIDASRRLAFVPCMTHFVMTFADLYNLVLPRDPPRDRYDELVNTHLSEDATHWKWFLADLANAGLDPHLRYTDALRFIWSDATTQSRLLSYRICQLSGAATSLETLVMVSCIEATGKVALQALATAGSAFERALGRKLVYFGPHHVETESTHAVEMPAVRSSIEQIRLSDPDSRAMCVLAGKTFALFESAVEQMGSIAMSGERLDRFVNVR